MTLQMCDVLENRQDTHNLHQKNTAIDNFDRCKSQKTLQFISTVPGLKTASIINLQACNKEGRGSEPDLKLIAKS